MRAKQSAAERRNRMRDKQKGGGRYAFIAPELIIQAKQMDLLTYLKIMNRMSWLSFQVTPIAPEPTIV